MRRSVAVTWHASFTVLAAVGYFFFVLPRWPELTGSTSHTLGTVFRILVGALIGLTALPVVFTLQRTRRPEYQTPRLALGLRAWSIVLHVLAGALIVGAAVSEIWLSLDAAGQWLFGVYGAAAAITLLGVLAFYLAFVAELPPPPPKPLKPKKPKINRRRRKQAAEDTETEDTETEDADETESADEDVPADEADVPEDAEVTAEDTAAEQTEGSGSTSDEAPEDAAEESAGNGRLRNRRPSGTRRRRLRGGVAVED